MNDPSLPDIQAILMVSTIKLTWFSWSRYDASRNSLPPDHARYVISNQPSLLEMFGYSFFFLGSWVGPGFHYSTYINFVEGKVAFSDAGCL